MTPAPATSILAINAGSSSIKFALYRMADEPVLVFQGAISDIGTSRSCFQVSGGAGDCIERHFAIPEPVTAASVLCEWLGERVDGATLAGVAHRLVYSGPIAASIQLLDGKLIGALYECTGSEPDHLPQQLHLIEMLRLQFHASAHFACFDSGFHSTMPAAAATLPIPLRYRALGIRRYGFHGLACAWLVHQLAREAGAQAAAGKIVIAHLGGGASVTAVEHGCSRDTTMGVTPAGGIMMGKRSGDLDPGLAWHLARHAQVSQSAFHHMVNHESGLLGISGSSGDLRELLARSQGDSRAAEAVDMFCYQVRKAVCSMAGAIDGMETLIFSGGVGNHAPQVRAQICANLSHLGVLLDPASNSAGAGLISSPSSAVSVRVMEADEQSMMAQQVRAQLCAPSGTGGEPS